VENNRMQTLPERSQRDHWKYLYKNKNKIRRNLLIYT
jgi:hypothetical protein